MRKVCLRAVSLILGASLSLGVMSGCQGKTSDTDKETKTEAKTEVKTETGSKQDVAAKTSLKLDEGKDWVYDADIKVDGAPESYTRGDESDAAYFVDPDALKFSLKDYRAPIINVDSAYANKCNEEMKQVYCEAIERYKEGATDPNIGVKQCDYKYWINGDCLSVLMIYWKSGTDVIHPKYYVYNINIKTGESMSGNDILEIAGGNSLKGKIDDKIDHYAELFYARDVYGTEEAQKKIIGVYKDDAKGFERYMETYDLIRYFLSDDSSLSVVYPILIPVQNYYREEVLSSNGDLDVLTHKFDKKN